MATVVLPDIALAIPNSKKLPMAAVSPAAAAAVNTESVWLPINVNALQAIYYRMI